MDERDDRPSVEDPLQARMAGLRAAIREGWLAQREKIELSRASEGGKRGRDHGASDAYFLGRGRRPEDEVDDVDNDYDSSPRVGRGGARRQQQQQRPGPAIPDLRFQEGYLRSLQHAEGVWWRVALITLRDQVVMPFAQGLVYNLLLCGWVTWNRSAQLHGNSVGARVRRWWYDVNNWALPPAPKRSWH